MISETQKKNPILTDIQKDKRIIDTMLQLPDRGDLKAFYDSFAPLLRDEESKNVFQMPAQYMFKNLPTIEGDPLDAVIHAMDANGVGRALVSMREDSDICAMAHEKYPDRFLWSYSVNPHDGMETIRAMRSFKKAYDIKAVTAFPAGLMPQVPLNNKVWYPVYATCVDLDIPFVSCVGVPGPRVPLFSQCLEPVDEVCWFFPELRFVMRHGAMPWTDLATRLMLKYPNLSYSTSAMAPRHYPKDVIRYANSRGSSQLIYAGYFPMGLTLERIFDEMHHHLDLKDDLWHRFLYKNACKIFHLKE